MTHIVVSVTGPDAATAAAQAREAEAVGADLVEIRLDLLPSLEDGLGLIKGRTVPVIATCRRAAEGGGFQGDEKARRKVLEAAAKAGCAWVDLERDVLAWKPKNVKVIGSHHDFQGVPKDAAAIVKGLLAGGADVAKLAATPASLREAKALLDLNALAPGKVAAFGMGVRGVPTRLLAGRAGAWAVYCAPDFGPPAAPGQLPLSELLFPFRFREVTAGTRLYALLGSPVAQSPGAWAHTAAMRLAGIDGLYLPLDAADADDARFALKGEGFGLAGASVTRPFKQDLLPVATELEEEAETVGALNTLARIGDKGQTWLGANTDASGLRRLLRGLRLKGNPRVAVYGAGGLARAALAAAGSLGWAAAVSARRTTELKAPLVGVADLPGFDVVIQTTPVGGVEDPDGMPFDAKLLRKTAVLVEAHVWPLETPLTRAARVSGVRVVSGFELWLAQAREQFALWHEREPEGGALTLGALAFLSRRGPPRSLALSGMRGSGKTTVGKLVAGKLSLPFLDLDAVIEAEAGMPVAEVFSERGEEGFRRIETRALARLSVGPPGVLALGGGTLTREENGRLLVGFARNVLLEAPVKVLKARLGKDAGARPSLTGKGVLAELGDVWKAREESYRRWAQATVKADAAPEAVAGRVMKAAGREEP